jgi:hypothetical protein
MLNLNWSPLEYVALYSMCMDNILRGIDALGVDRDIQQDKWSISLYVLARNITPRASLINDHGRCDVGIYLASHTG